MSVFLNIPLSEVCENPQGRKVSGMTVLFQSDGSVVKASVCTQENSCYAEGEGVGLSSSEVEPEQLFLKGSAWLCMGLGSSRPLDCWAELPAMTPAKEARASPEAMPG